MYRINKRSALTVHPSLRIKKRRSNEHHLLGTEDEWKMPKNVFPPKRKTDALSMILREQSKHDYSKASQKITFMPSAQFTSNTPILPLLRHIRIIRGAYQYFSSSIQRRSLSLSRTLCAPVYDVTITSTEWKVLRCRAQFSFRFVRLFLLHRSDENGKERKWRERRK